MSDDLSFEARPRPRRFGGTLAAVVIAFVLGVALMIYAACVLPHWFVPAATPAAATAPDQPAAPAAAPTPITDPAELQVRGTQLAAQLASLESRAASINSDTQVAASNAGRAEAILIAFAARRAIDRGVGLGYLEQQLRARFGAIAPRQTDQVIAAARAPVTIEDLRESLDAAEPTLLAGGNRWWAGLGAELRSLVVVHRAGTPSPLPADRIARARRLLEGGNVEAALGEVRRLPGAGDAASWTAAAERYVATHRALDTLETAAIVYSPPRAAPAPPVASDQPPAQ